MTGNFPNVATAYGTLKATNRNLATMLWGAYRLASANPDAHIRERTASTIRAAIVDVLDAEGHDPVYANRMIDAARRKESGDLFEAMRRFTGEHVPDGLA